MSEIDEILNQVPMDQVAAALGVDQSEAEQATRTAIPALLGGMQANAADPVLNLIEWEVRRKTLIAERETRGSAVVYRFDIHLQGPQETVFFDI